MTWMEFLTLCNVICNVVLILQNSSKNRTRNTKEK